MQSGMYSDLPCDKDVINDPAKLVETIKQDAKALNYTFFVGYFEVGKCGIGE